MKVEWMLRVREETQIREKNSVFVYVKIKVIKMCVYVYVCVYVCMCIWMCTWLYIISVCLFFFFFEVCAYDLIVNLIKSCFYL